MEGKKIRTKRRKEPAGQQNVGQEAMQSLLVILQLVNKAIKYTQTHTHTPTNTEWSQTFCGIEKELSPALTLVWDKKVIAQSPMQTQRRPCSGWEYHDEQEKPDAHFKDLDN